MIVIPAMDLMGGRVVRLSRGDPGTAKTYLNGMTPAEVAAHWEAHGAEYLHVVDLDAALGKTGNTATVKSILESVDIPVQVGGGIRSKAKAVELLEAGASRVVIGSFALKSPESASELLDAYSSDTVAIALDHRDGVVLTKGWTESSDTRLTEALDLFTGYGFRWFLVTDVNRDGMLTGPDTETYRVIASKGNMVASGGVGSLRDIEALTDTGVKAVIVGKALYEERFTLEQALEAARC